MDHVSLGCVHISLYLYILIFIYKHIHLCMYLFMYCLISIYMHLFIWWSRPSTLPNSTGCDLGWDSRLRRQEINKGIAATSKDLAPFQNKNLTDAEKAELTQTMAAKVCLGRAAGLFWGTVTMMPRCFKVSARSLRTCGSWEFVLPPGKQDRGREAYREDQGQSGRSQGKEARTCKAGVPVLNSVG